MLYFKRLCYNKYMNPSYKNGGPNIPGVKPGIISSGPDDASAASPVNGPVNPVVTRSGNLVAPTNSATPVNPVAPVNPVVPTTPVNPAAPTNPMAPVNPVAPVSSATQVNPMTRANSTVNPFAGPSRQPTGGRPMNSNMTINEDIVLNNDEPDNRKRNWIIAGAIFGVVTVVVVVVLMVMMGVRGEITEKISKIKVYVEKGAGFVLEDDEIVPSGDFIYAIRVGKEGITGITKRYYTELKEKMDAVNNANGIVEIYLNDLKMLSNIMNNEVISSGLLAAYDKDGDDGAKKYFDNNISCGDYSDDLSTVCEQVEAYYERLLSEHKVYATAGCIKKEVYDNECAITHYSKEVILEQTALAGVKEKIMQSLRSDTTLTLFNTTLLSVGQNVNGGNV